MDQRGALSFVLLRIPQLLLNALLDQLNLRLLRQSQSPIRGPLIQRTHQLQFPFLSRLPAVEDLLLVLVDKVEMLHLAVSVAMAMAM
jgi:hypothetical protein